MIASVRGLVRAVRLDGAVLEVGGVGLSVAATPGTVAGLRVGAEAELSTSLVVREDSLTLFGFADDDERDVFEILQTVSGVGPRLALAMLAVHSPDGLRAAVSTGNLTVLMQVPGIGKKGAQRIVLELTDRLGPPTGGVEGTAVGASAGVVGSPATDQVVEALVGLGWSAKPATEAVEAVLAERAEAGEPATSGAPGDIAAILRLALRRLGRA